MDRKNGLNEELSLMIIKDRTMEKDSSHGSFGDDLEIGDSPANNHHHHHHDHQQQQQHQSRMLSIKRRLYTRADVDRAYPREDDAPSLRRYLRENYACTGMCFLRTVVGFFPIFGFLRRYKWRSDVISDFMAGLSVSFLMIPQGFALGLLSTLPPVYGMYTTFFPLLTYLIFGTSQFTSMGTNALIAVMTSSIIQSHRDRLMSSNEDVTTLGAGVKNDTEKTTTLFNDSDEELAFKVGVTTSVTFLSGLFLLAAGFLRLGFITRYFSTAFVGGFTTATGVHILTSQISKLINIKITVYSGAGKIVKTYVDIFKNIGDANPADIVISVISLAFLLLVTIYVNEKYKHRLKVPVPIQLILVTISTVISHFARLEERFGISVIGDVPTGIPTPSIPHPQDYPGVAYDAITVAILVFTISITLSKLTAKIYHSDMDDNQECLAYGVTNIFSSFFGCFSACNAPPRAMILGGVGAKSTLHGVVSAIVILIVLLAASPLFSSLPVAVLAAMICAAIKNILLQVTQLPSLWKTSKPDCIVWVLTCLISIFADLDIGILAGVLLSFFSIIVKNQLASGSVGSVSGSEDLIHLDGKRKGVQSLNDFVIFYFPSQLNFANCEKFKTDLFSKTFDPRKEQVKEEKNVEENGKDANSLNRKSFKYVVIQCSAMTCIDIDGAKVMEEIAELYRKAGVSVLLSNCNDHCLYLLERVGYFKTISKDSVYFDVHDAVSFIMDLKPAIEPGSPTGE